MRLLPALFAFASAALAADPQVVYLWPDGAPGSEGKTADESVRMAGADHVVSSVHRPSITVYLPAKPTGAGVLLMPGGGHSELWIDHEGFNEARFFSEHGVAGFVLKYRLAREKGSTYTIEGHALADAQRAMKVIRAHAAEWSVDPSRVGVMGFSAGGEVAALTATRWDADPETKPAFQALIYPAIPRDMKFSKDTPPAFLACGENDRQNISQGLPELYLQLKRAGASAELHVFAGIGHGFGLRPTLKGEVANWPAYFLGWLEARKLVAAAPSSLSTVTIAGTGVAGFSGDGGPGTQAQINNPYGLVTGPDGALYFCEIGNHRIRRLDLKTGTISTAAGSGQKGYAGDGGPALAASMNEPYEIRFDKAGNMFFAEMQNHVVRRVDAKTHVISTVAGTGVAGFSGDGGPANQAQLRQPHSIAFDAQGRLLICDIGNHRVRRVDLAAGTIETWLGTGERKPTPDGAPLAGTPINGPRAITAAPDGQLYLVLREGNAVYRVDPVAGKFIHIAGTGVTGYEGDGGPAKLAKLSGPKGIAWAPDNSLYLADTESHTIRRIDLKTGIIHTVASQLKRPHGIFVADSGVVYVSDSENHRLLKLP